VAGTYGGSPAAEEEEAIVGLVNVADADILLVAYGAPKQDKWIARNLPRLQTGVAMGVGGSFDFISGKAVRAPVWLRRLGLEWLHRLVHEPWRWRRMVALPRFALAVLVAGLTRSRRRAPGRGSGPSREVG
jgi:N-acetylglucosaminyldiphosphoundecaprenol N-acetyl-beta-D-mannosaminyltransferase